MVTGIKCDSATVRQRDRTRGRKPRSARRAFTLLETMMSLVIIGVGVLAFVDAQAAFTKSNGWSSQAATGMLLANEVREFSRRLPRHDPVTGLILTGSGASVVLQGWGREASELTVDDIDDLDDLDGMKFGSGGTFPGPIDAFGKVIPEISLDGAIEMNGTQQVSMQGWAQRVVVEKVDPYNFNTVRAPSYQQASTGQLPAIAVDQFPLRVTVIVEYTSPGATTANEITRLTWVVSP
jgi:prepilin-type N-terminal cleavage/methylation domain-containing protein